METDAGQKVNYLLHKYYIHNTILKKDISAIYGPISIFFTVLKWGESLDSKTVKNIEIGLQMVEILVFKNSVVYVVLMK